MSEYLDDVKRYTAKADENAVAGIVKHLGIALKSKDASLVSCSSKDELARVTQLEDKGASEVAAQKLELKSSMFPKKYCMMGLI